jgi:orotidine-5'-phosphate decarboxylase
MKRADLINQIRLKRSFLCTGLDPDIDKIPKHLLEEEDPIYEFNKMIIDSTADHCVAYKPNSAFYEAYGLSGIASLEKTIRYIHANYPEHFVIADAKRGDIGHTSGMYAKAFFKRMGAHAVTVNPYMGRDSVQPFLDFPDKWAVVLTLTSNEGSSDFEQKKIDGRELYLHVIDACKKWGTPENMMFVVGATKTEMIAGIRKLVPDHFFLVPGVGAQGGSLQEVCRHGMNKDVGLLVNASRSILYASDGKDFAEKAGLESKKLAGEMAAILATINTY